MNSARLLELYEQIADAPGAVARLRHLILDLAVRGKLLAQDPRDVPASEMLSHAASSWILRLNGSGERNNDGTHLWPIPTNWLFVPLEILAEPRGFFTDGDWVESKDQDPDGDVRLIQLADVGAGVYRDRSARFMTRTAASRLNCTYLSIGDVLIARMPDPLGRACIFPGDPKPSVTVVDVAILRVDANCFDPRFVMHAINSHHFASNVQSKVAGTTRARISGGNLRRLPFPVPPLAEQHRIVAKVDELMELCGKLESARAKREARRDLFAAASLARLNAPDPNPASFAEHTRFALESLEAHTARPDQIKQLRKTILNLAVYGKLVPQKSNDEPAAELLKRIAMEKASLLGERSRKSSAIRPLSADAAPFAVAHSWVWAHFGDIVVSRDGERIPVSREERNTRAKTFDYYGASGVIDKIDGYLFDRPLLLIGEDGANLVNRSTPIAFMARGKYWVNNHAHVLDGLSEDLLRYLELFVNATDLKPYVTGTAQPKLNQAKMNRIPIALPPLAEQRRIVAKVEDLMALCDRLERSLAACDETRSLLLDALIAEALRPADRDAEAACASR